MTKTSWFSFFLVGALLLSYGILSYLKLKKNQAALPNPIVSESQQLSSSANSPKLLLRGKIDHYDQTQQLLYLQTAEQLVTYPLALDTELACWPTWQNGVQISEAYLPLGPGQVIYITGETKTPLRALNLAKLSGKYLFLQQDEQTQLVKVALINCYD